jgi:hypothetical protein
MMRAEIRPNQIRNDGIDTDPQGLVVCQCCVVNESLLTEVADGWAEIVQGDKWRRPCWGGDPGLLAWVIVPSVSLQESKLCREDLHEYEHITPEAKRKSRGTEHRQRTGRLF